MDLQPWQSPNPYATMEVAPVLRTRHVWAISRSKHRVHCVRQLDRTNRRPTEGFLGPVPPLYYVYMNRVYEKNIQRFQRIVRDPDGVGIQNQPRPRWTSSWICLSPAGRSGPNSRVGSTPCGTDGVEGGPSLGSDQPIRLHQQSKKQIRTRES